MSGSEGYDWVTCCVESPSKDLGDLDLLHSHLCKIREVGSGMNILVPTQVSPTRRRTCLIGGKLFLNVLSFS